ncbi:MAG: hypothetical protein IJX80_09225 [Clostridia bacterium]|nr:hypothetical protein [Clostridia bacterium]
MTYQEILDASVRMVCEGTYSDSYTKDYTERAPYILAAFLSHCASLDVKYRRAHGLEEAEPFEGVTVTLTDSFLLPTVFSAAAIFYLSAMLTIEESEEMSDRFFALCSDALSAIEAALPTTVEAIVDKYE